VYRAKCLGLDFKMEMPVDPVKKQARIVLENAEN